jgi:ribosomal-protein-alanine N-acetyltransferase
VIRENNIVLARTQDAGQIASMSKELVEFGLGWRWTSRRIAASIRDPDRNVAVVKQGDRVIGFGIMEYGLDVAHLLLFAVAPDRRRQRIGSRLLIWLEKTAIVAGVAVIYLETRQSNRSGRRFYGAHGYQEIELVQGYYSGRESAVRMMRRLRPESPEQP